MTIRKTGSVTGRVTGIEETSDVRLLKEAALARIAPPGWREEDERALADENRRVDIDDADERRGG